MTKVGNPISFLGIIIPGLLGTLLVLSSFLSSANGLEFQAIVPDHVAFTVRKSPVLYFYISHATSREIRFALVDSRKVRPEAEVLLPSPTRPGLVAIRLEDYHIELEEEVQYRWYVSVISSDLVHPDIVAGGVIQRVDPRLVDYYGHSCDTETQFFQGSRPAFGMMPSPVSMNLLKPIPEIEIFAAFEIDS